MKMKKKTGIIFDLDGTLWDAAETIAPCWNACMKSRGISRSFTPDDCRSFCGKTLEQIAALIFPSAEPAWREAVLLDCCASECEPLARQGGTLYPGEEAVLSALHERYFLAVVSNCQEGYIEAFFAGNRTGPFFDDYESAGGSGLSKAENIRLVMERNGIEQAVYVGDTDGDRNAARAAGVPFIHAAYGYGRVTDPDHTIRRFEDLLKLFPVDKA